MGKSRMTALDLRAVARSLNEQANLWRVANIYDISSKLSSNDDADKKYLLLQSGIRAHLSKWKRNKQAIPSVFTMKLRKFIRTKRVTEIKQLGSDRVLDLQFGREANAVHLIVEFYARGNIILTDHEYTVISAWRQFKGDESLAVRVKGKYPMDQYIANDILSIWRESEGVLLYCDPTDGTTKSVRQAVEDVLSGWKEAGESERDKPGKKNANQKSGVELISALAPSCHRQMVIDHCSPFLKGVTLGTDAIDMNELVQQVEQTLRGLLDIWKKVDHGPWPGYVYKKDGQLQNLSPYPLEVDASTVEQKYDSFDDAADEYFTLAEVEKAEKLEGTRLSELESKVDKIKKDQFDRVRQLEEQATQAENHANAVEYHVQFITKVIDMMKRLVDSGTDWTVLKQSIKDQSRNNHPVASYIIDTDFAKSRVQVLVPASHWGDEEDFDSQLGRYKNNHQREEVIEVNFGDEDSSSEDPVEDAVEASEGQFIAVWVNYKTTAYANVVRLHDEKKQALAKFEKTKIAAAQVLKQAEELKAREAAKKASSAAQQAISKTRKVFWFEKFFWFISSDRYLVIAGHDAIQNEILYKKYLGKHDIYVHADVHGAASCIIRNPNPAIPVPETTIQEAGILSVCRSNAWKTKVLTTAYWVYAHQVSKTPQAGEYVATGGFIIRGKRNPIRVHKLELGICVMFCLGDSKSIARHKHESAPDNEQEPPPFQNLPYRRDSVKSNASGKVQFGNLEIAPIADEPPQGISLGPKQILPIRSESDGARSDSNDVNSGVGTTTHDHGTQAHRTLRRPDSADELPPPEEYADRAAPAPLLRKQTPETKDMVDLLRDAEDAASPIPAKRVSKEVAQRLAEEHMRRNFFSSTKKVEELREFNEEEERAVQQEWEEKLSVLDELTGRPYENDLLLFAICMVGPISAMRDCKFKGRLLPGGGKKGQAISVVQRAFIEMTPKDSIVRSLVKNVTVDELSAVVPANPVVQMEGADKIQKADKKDKKALKKLNKQ